MRAEVLVLGPFESGVLGKGPVCFRGGIVDRRLEDSCCIDAREHLTWATHSK